MNKFILSLIGIGAIVTFCFFSPLFIIVFGLCILLIGIVSLFQPEFLKMNKIKDPFYKRIISFSVGIIGAVLLTLGSITTYQLYLQPNSTDNWFNSSHEDPQSFGTDTNRPGTNNETSDTLPNNKKQLESEKNKTVDTSSSSGKPITTNTADNTLTQKTSNTSTKSTTVSTNTSTTSTSSTFPGKGNGLDKTKTTPASSHTTKK